jgi:hypothetical protein
LSHTILRRAVAESPDRGRRDDRDRDRGDYRSRDDYRDRHDQGYQGDSGYRSDYRDHEIIATISAENLTVTQTELTVHQARSS